MYRYNTPTHGAQPPPGLTSKGPHPWRETGDKPAALDGSTPPGVAGKIGADG